MMRNLADILRLVLVTDDRLVGDRDLVALCLSAERGGVSSIQLRLKDASPRELAAAARALLAVLRVPLFINDRLDVAIAVGAAGVHLGPGDMPVALARRIAPIGLVIGASVGTVDEAGSGQSADYWGIGPVNGSSTKADAGAPIGMEGFARLARLAPTHIPCVAIGGITPDDLSPVRAAGGAGVAVVRGILAAVDAETSARTYGLHG